MSVKNIQVIINTDTLAATVQAYLTGINWKPTNFIVELKKNGDVIQIIFNDRHFNYIITLWQEFLFELSHRE